nr:serine protease inhibitor Kazal-type 6 [Dasypus novemcinctus]
MPKEYIGNKYAFTWGFIRSKTYNSKTVKVAKSMYHPRCFLTELQLKLIKDLHWIFIRAPSLQSACRNWTYASPQSRVFSQGGQDKRGWIARSEGRLPGKGVLRMRLFQVDCSEFRDPKVYCTRESNPHCGSDGQTYGNQCAFCKAVAKSGGKINLKHHGKC